MRTITDDDARAIAVQLFDTLEDASAPLVPYPPIGSCGNGAIVYFIRFSRFGPVKIGQTKDLVRRLSNLQMGSPYPLHIAGWYWTDDADAEETRLHEKFLATCMRGEWHRPSGDLDNEIACANRRSEERRDALWNTP